MSWNGTGWMCLPLRRDEYSRNSEREGDDDDVVVVVVVVVGVVVVGVDSVLAVAEESVVAAVAGEDDVGDGIEDDWSDDGRFLRMAAAGDEEETAEPVPAVLAGEEM